MGTKLISFISLILMWYGLCGFPHNISAIYIAIICVVITYYLAFYLTLLPLQDFKFNYRFIFYLFWLEKEILKSSIAVIRIIWSSQLRITSAFEWVEFDNHRSQGIGLVLYGNSITLTPGTVTVDTKDNMLLIQALTQSSLDDLQKGEMVRKVYQASCHSEA